MQSIGERTKRRCFSMEGTRLPKSDSAKERKKPSGFKRALLMVAGTFSLVLGGLGVFLPVLPTTPFLLLSAACYSMSSERMHHWMLNNRLFGSYIKNYQEGRGLPLKTKIFTLSLLWIVISYSAILVVNIFIVQIILFMVAIGVSIHIINLPTFKENNVSNLQKQ